MSIASIYTYARWEDGPDDVVDFGYADNNPAMPSEALTSSQGAIWWTAALDTTEDE